MGNPQRLGALIRERFQHRMEGEPVMAGDTLLVRFDSGLTLEVEPAGDVDLSYSWSWSSPDWGLETDFAGWNYTLYKEDIQPEEPPDIRARITQPTKASWPELLAVLDAMFKNTPQLRRSPR